VSPAFSITRRAAACATAVTLMMLKPVLRETEAKRRQGSFGGEAAAPSCLVQLEPHLDPVDIRPVIELIETDLTDPAAGSLVDSRPWAEPAHAPLSQAAFRDPGDSVRGRSRPPLTAGSLTRR